MKQLINNNWLWILSKYIMPCLGGIVFILSFMTLFTKTYFYFFEYDVYIIYKRLLLSSLKEFKLESKDSYWSTYSWRGYEVILWHDSKTISVHKDNYCHISAFYSAWWDKNMNHQIYYLLN